MHLTEIENELYRDDPAAALAQAKADIPSLEENLKKAEVKLYNASSECNRLKALFSSLTEKVASLGNKSIVAKRLALDTVAMGRADADFTAFRRLRGQRDDVASALSYVTSFSRADAEIAELGAKIEARSAEADLWEGRATAQRLASILAACAAFEFDPGASIDVKSSWSQQQMEKVNDIRSVELPRLRVELQELRQRSAAEQELVSPNLFK